MYVRCGFLQQFTSEMTLTGHTKEGYGKGEGGVRDKQRHTKNKKKPKTQKRTKTRTNKKTTNENIPQ